MAGLFTTVALLGSIFGYLPSLDHWLPYTWQQFTIISGAGLLMLVMLFSVFMQDQNQIPVLPQWSELQNAVKNPQNWLLAGFNGLALAPLIILAGLAGRPYFEQNFQYSHSQLAELGGCLLLGLALGGPLAGYFSDRMKRRRAVMLMGILIQEIIFVPLIYLDQTPFWLHSVFLLIFGLASGVFILSFAIAKEINPLPVIGMVSAIMNTGIISITALTDHMFGKFLSWQWDGKIVDGVRYFSLYDFHIAFTIFPVYLLLGFILLLFVDEPAFW
jgi:MFS family permease